MYNIFRYLCTRIRWANIQYYLNQCWFIAQWIPEKRLQKWNCTMSIFCPGASEMRRQIGYAWGQWIGILAMKIESDNGNAAVYHHHCQLIQCCRIQRPYSNTNGWPYSNTKGHITNLAANEMAWWINIFCCFCLGLHNVDAYLWVFHRTVWMISQNSFR